MNQGQAYPNRFSSVSSVTGDPSYTFLTILRMFSWDEIYNEGVLTELPNVTLNRNTRAFLYLIPMYCWIRIIRVTLIGATYYFAGLEGSGVAWSPMKSLTPRVPGDRSTLIAGVSATAPVVHVVGWKSLVSILNARGLQHEGGWRFATNLFWINGLLGLLIAALVLVTRHGLKWWKR